MTWENEQERLTQGSRLFLASPEVVFQELKRLAEKGTKARWGRDDKLETTLIERNDHLINLSLAIPRSRHDPKILWVDDAEIVGDRITKVRPIPRNLFTQKTERRIGELGASCVALVVSDVSVHEAP